MAQDNPYADIVPNAPVAAPGGAYTDILPGGAPPSPDVARAAEGQPARITVRPPGAPETVAGRPVPVGNLANAIEPVASYLPAVGEMAASGANTAYHGLGQIAQGLSSSSDENRALESAIEGIQQGRDINYAVERASPGPSMPVPTPGMKVAAGVGNIAQGAAEFAYSPIGGLVRTILGIPLQNTTGVPKEYTEFAAAVALPGPKRLPAAPIARAAPTVPELKAAGAVDYNAPEVVNTMLPVEHGTRLADNIMVDLAKGRVSDVTAPDVFKLVDKLAKPPEGAVGFSVDNLESLRRQLGDVSQPIKDGTGRVINGPEIRAAGIARDRIDSFLKEAAPEAAAKLETARANTSAAFSAENIDRKAFRAELRAAAANSGRNLSNTMRSRMADILLNPAERRGYSVNELGLMERIVRGGRIENYVRGAGNFLGGGGGLGAMVTTAEGARALGPVGALLALPGAALKSLSNVMTARNIEKLNEMIRADSPLGRQMKGPLTDWSRIHSEAAANPTPGNLARLGIASQNLSNNFRDAGIEISPLRLSQVPSDTESQ